LSSLQSQAPNGEEERNKTVRKAVKPKTSIFGRFSLGENRLLLFLFKSCQKIVFCYYKSGTLGCSFHRREAMAKKMKKPSQKTVPVKRYLSPYDKALYERMVLARARQQAKRQSIKVKAMYHLEKFFPPECPKCRHKFEKQEKDWAILLGDKVDGKKTVRETIGYDIIICSHCGNHTARVPLETAKVFRLKTVRQLQKKGFVNLQKVQAFGNMAKEIRAVHSKAPNMRVIGVKVEDQ
jgi:hypothetical protein